MVFANKALYEHDAGSDMIAQTDSRQNDSARGMKEATLVPTRVALAASSLRVLWSMTGHCVTQRDVTQFELVML